MHPVIIQAVATERSAEMRAHAAAARQALQTRRSRPAGPGLRRGLVRAYPDVPARAAAAARPGSRLRRAWPGHDPGRLEASRARPGPGPLLRPAWPGRRQGGRVVRVASDQPELPGAADRLAAVTAASLR